MGSGITHNSVGAEMSQAEYESASHDLSLLNIGAEVELTISGGAVAITQSNHTIDTQADGATDDLDNATGGAEGAIITIRPADTTRTVVVKHASGGAGQFRLSGSGDFSMDSAFDTLTCIYTDNNEWQEIGRCEN